LFYTRSVDSRKTAQRARNAQGSMVYAREVFEWLPAGVEFMDDVTPADWLTSTLEPWGAHGVRLGSFMLSRFEAYARIFHPFDVAQDPPVPSPRRWADLGAERGVALSPEVSFGDVSGLDEMDEMSGFYGLAPQPGKLLPATCEALAALLAPHTRTPQTCWFCIWEGYGLLVGPGHPFVIGGPTWRERRRQRKQDEAEQEGLRALAKVSIPGRSYLLFRGPLDAACRFEPWGFYLSLNIWWPDDRTWTVVTEVDGYTTYVGGARDTINDIVASPNLEALEVSRDVRVG
jgi:hypothetical protein